MMRGVAANVKRGRKGGSARAVLMVLLLGALAALAVGLTDHGLLRPAEAQRARR